jgi:HEAT repeat protein
MANGAVPWSCRSPRRAALALLVLAASCQRVSSDAISRWKSAPDGPDRLTAALKDPGGHVDLRAEAAATLVEIGYPERMSGTLAGLSLDDRARVIPLMVPLLARATDAADPTRAGDALEAIYAVRELATTDAAKNGIDAALFPALAKDVRAGRDKAGRYGVKDVLVGLGKASVPTLLGLLDDPQAPFPLAVEVLDKVGDAQSRGQGGASLVKRARATSPVPDDLWGAMATLGGKAVTDFLSERVERGTAGEREKAADTMTKVRRAPELLPLALRLAAAPATAPPLRESMFLVVEKIGDEAARKGLVELIHATEDNALRARAFRSALTVGRGKVIVAALEAVPKTAVYTQESLRADLVAPISAMPGLDSREGLFKAMESPAPLARLVAILVLEKMGFPSDGPHIAKLLADKGRVRGFPRQHTVGGEAARVVEVLRKAKT